MSKSNPLWHLAKIGLLLLPLLTIGGWSTTALSATTENEQSDSESPEEKAKRLRLENVKKQIQQQEEAIEKQQVKHRFLTNLLQKAEKEIADVARALNTIAKDRKANSEKLKNLEAERQTLSLEKEQHKKLLAGQLSSMYVTGKHDYSKLLLNQQEPGKLERVLGYYEYLNRARTENLDRIEEILARLTQIDAQLADTLVALEELEKSQKAKQRQLNNHQKERKRTIAQLKQKLRTEAQQLEQLKDDEQALTKALSRIEEMATQAIELAGLSHLKGELGWPVDGHLSNRFGNKRRGSLRWKGVLIDSQSGTPVKTIHQGMVLFADWLKGFGWVIVVDHGEGYMSLYGHNQTLLKTVGEKVETGEPIALVGKSGGQSKAGLYFELRHQGIAINPAFWCKAGV